MITKKNAREIAEQYLKVKGRNYSSIENEDKIFFRENKEILYGSREGEKADVFVVGYDLASGSDGMGLLIYIDANSGEVLYSMSATGWIEEFE